MTELEFFQEAATYLLGMEKQCNNDNGECVYRGENGSACVAGHFIPDEIYDKEFEGKTILVLVQDRPELKPFFPDITLARELQAVHDDSFLEREEKLNNLARIWGFPQPCRDHESFKPGFN